MAAPHLNTIHPLVGRIRAFVRRDVNTLVFTVASVCIKFVVGMAIALLLNAKLPFRSILVGLMLLPWIVPEVVTALTWRSIYDPIFGGLNLARGISYFYGELTSHKGELPAIGNRERTA